METLASQDELDLVAEELRKRCTASEAATIQRLRELSNAIAAGGGGGGGGGNIGSGGGAYADEDVPAGFRSPVRCISCNRPKSPGGRNSSPPREIRVMMEDFTETWTAQENRLPDVDPIRQCHEHQIVLQRCRRDQAQLG